MDTMAAIKQTFFQECEDQLAELESGLLAMERQESDSETINAAFRAVHSMKGGAGAFGLDELVRFAHTFETTLDLMRSNALDITNGLVKLMLRAADGLADLVCFARGGTELDRGRIAQLDAELTRAASGHAAPALEAPSTIANRGDGPDENGFTPIRFFLEDPIAADLGNTEEAASGPLVECFRPAPVEIVPVARSQAEGEKTPTEALIEAGMAQTTTQPAQQTTIRVDLDRVDRLIDLVGKLVITQSMLAQCVAEAGIARRSEVAAGLNDLEHLTRELQDSIMAIRAQPVRPIFQRMSRVARDVADMTGKSVRLVIEGENCEVDKTVVDRLADPLTHMIRNAIDHGIEKPEDRMASGKSEQGLVRMAAARRSGRVIIELSDDGAGIDRARVREIAVAKGLVDPNAQLSEGEVDDLIFAPGFSTASTVSEVSGRGVGMDVVKRSIQALGGRVSISSRPGQGTTFTLSLPARHVISHENKPGDTRPRSRPA